MYTVFGMKSLHPRLAWLRGRILPRNDPLVLVAYAMILTAIGTAMLVTPGAVLTWRFVGGILALVAMFVVQICQPTLEQNVSRPGIGGPYLLLSAVCLLLATWLIPSFAVNLLLFMLSSQAFAWLRPPMALLLIAPLIAALITLQWRAGAVPAKIGTEYLLGAGFSGMFSLVITSYFAQRNRLALANAALRAARERERELAAIAERVRIAREIHDGLGHQLTIIAVQLQAAEKLLARDPERVTALIANCRRATRAALDEVRRSVDIMRHPTLADHPIEDALRQLVQEFGHQAAAIVDFAHEGPTLPLAPEASATLYRVAQEGLTNAQKHAAGARIAVLLRHDPPLVRLTVRDTGGVAAPSHAEVVPSGGLGLRGLRERVEQLGGVFAARPDGSGFVVEAVVPAETAGAAR